MKTSSVPPYMDGLFMPATPVQQSNSGSVRNWLFILPEEHHKKGCGICHCEIPTLGTGSLKYILLFVCLSCSFLRMVIQMDRSLETKYSSLPAFSLPGSQMREKKKPTKLKTALGSNLKELATVKQ